jgi:hypothetical protein
MSEASDSGQRAFAIGLSAHFSEVLTVVGVTKYAELFPAQAEALAAL